VRGVFDLRPLDPISVKGKTEPLKVYLVERAKPRAFHMGLRGVEDVETQMIGRQEELRTLQEALEAVVTLGQGRTVTISGRAGVGKSRLLYEFENWIGLQPARVRLFKGRARPETRGQPYGLLRDLFASLFQIRDDDSENDVRHKMEEGFDEALSGMSGANSRDLDELVLMKAHFVGQLLGFDLGESPYLSGIGDDAQQLHRRGLIYMAEFMKVTATTGPVLVLLEDLHWTDGSSLDALDQLAQATRDCPLLILGTTRPEMFERRPDWGKELKDHSEVELHRLSEQDSCLLVREVLKRVDDIPSALEELVVRNAEGNPFYVEELVKMLIDDGVIVKGDTSWQVKSDLLAVDRVPATLTGVLQARLDSLAPYERTVLQEASVIGRTFWDTAVEFIGSDESPMQLSVYGSLASLRDKEMVFQRDHSALSGTEEYMFKHVILREVTYESVLKRLRRTFHRLTVEWLISRVADRPTEYAGLIADHLEKAGENERCVVYLRQAGEAAAGRYANPEAADYFSRALELTPGEDLSVRFDIRLRLGKVLEAASKWEEAGKQYREALTLAQNPALDLLEPDYQGWAEAAIGELLRKQGQYTEAADWLGRARSRFEAIENLEGIGQVLHYMGTLASQQGDFEEAQASMEDSLAIRQQLGDSRQSASLLGNLGIVAVRQGHLGQARQLFKQCLALRRQVGDRWGVANVSSNLGLLMLDLGDADQARHLLEEAVAIHRDLGDRWSIGNALNNLGNVMRDAFDEETADRLYDESLTIYHDLGDKWALAYLLEDVGQLASRRGDAERAYCLVGAAATLRDQIGAPLTATEEESLTDALEPALAALSDDARAEATDRGRQMGLAEAVDFAQSGY
jgi:predicted ATPase